MVRAAFLLVFAALSWLPRAADAQTVFRCVGPDGRSAVGPDRPHAALMGRILVVSGVLLVAVPGRSLPPHAASNTAKEQARLAFTNPLKSVFMY